MAHNDGSKDLDRIKRAIERRARAIERDLGNEVLVSIRDGSPITGAPGQPFKTGELRDSWKMTISGTIIRVFSPLFWAEFIEEGFRQRTPTSTTALGRAQFRLGVGFGRRVEFTLRSKKGGFHSVKITRANIQRVVDMVVNRARESVK